MNRLMIITALGSLALAACENRLTGDSPYDSGTTRAAPPAQTNTTGPGGQTYSTATGNSMPGTRVGFNNDEITGKSRNPNSTTPGTGPMNSNPVASGNVPR
jgi:hypothetical protein